jgi:hypothetical protein
MVVESALRKSANVMIVERALLISLKKGFHEWHSNSVKLYRRFVVSETSRSLMTEKILIMPDETQDIVRLNVTTQNSEVERQELPV